MCIILLQINGIQKINFTYRKRQSSSSFNSSFFPGASEWELEQANLTVERVVMGRVYRQAMFPNGDGDVMRDQCVKYCSVSLVGRSRLLNSVVAGCCGIIWENCRAPSSRRSPG